MKFTRRIALGFMFATGMMASVVTATTPAHAWEPTKPVDFVIMAGAGGGADQIARFIQSVAEKKKLTVRPLVPNNKGGGSGAEALIALNGASDKDHSILVTLNSFFTTPIRQPDSIVIAWMEKNFDVKIKYIPYKGGGAVAKDLAGQQIMASVNNPSEAKGFFESGDVVPLIAFSDERLPNLPDTRTIKELDKDFSYYNQRAVVGAPGMSDDAAAYYRDLFQKIYDSEEWQDYMKSESLEPLPMDAATQKKYWKTQVDRHNELLKAIGG